MTSSGLRPIPPPCLSCGSEASWIHSRVSWDAPRGHLGGFLGASWGLLWGLLGASWAVLGLSCAVWPLRGPSGGPLAATLGLSRGPLGPSWGPLGPSWGPLAPSGPFGGRLGGLSGPPWGPLGVLLGRLGGLLGCLGTLFVIGLNAGVADTGGATAAALQNLETLPNDAVQDSIHASSGSQGSHVIFPE